MTEIEVQPKPLKRRTVAQPATPDAHTLMGWQLTLAADKGKAQERAMQYVLSGEDRLPKAGGLSSDDRAKGKQHHATRQPARGKRGAGRKRPTKKASGR